MPELLLEVGTEELPATFVRKAANDLLALVSAALKDSGLLVSGGVAYGTPRRLIVSFPDVLIRQADSTKEQRGPAIKSAFDANGNPTPALLGFCRGQGVDVAAIRTDEQYVWITKQIVGQPAAQILAAILPEAIRKLSFEKSMRWGSSRMRFARPIRWLLAAFDGVAVPFEIEGVKSGLTSKGHRFYSPDPFEATTLEALLAGLRERKVEPENDVRRQVILDQAASVADGTPDLPESLVDENAYLTEWPTAISGSFKPDFLELPEPVLVTAMAKHEKMFPVRDASGKLTNQFVFVRNGGVDETVRRGAEWVLNARFNDARFFYEEDKKHTLDEFLTKTEGILFQEKLGTVRARADRLSALAQAAAQAWGYCDHGQSMSATAGLYAKADLSTGLVSELSSLQGVIGGEYARRAGLEEPVCLAIAAQYDPAKAAGLEKPASHVVAALVVADQLDKLAGYLGLGLAPSGSKDPFGLRRAATLLIEGAWQGEPRSLAYLDLLEKALDLYAGQGVNLDRSAAQKSFAELFESRYSALLPQVRHDLLEAALAQAGTLVTEPRAIRFRATVLAKLADDVPFVQTATRPLNILAYAQREGIASAPSVDPAALDSAEGVALLKCCQTIASAVSSAVESEDADQLVAELAKLSEPIKTFFDTAMVMADDPVVRASRLALMQLTAELLLKAGDFGKVVIEG